MLAFGLDAWLRALLPDLTSAIEQELGEAESQGFSELAHGSTGTGHRHLSWGGVNAFQASVTGPGRLTSALPTTSRGMAISRQTGWPKPVKSAAKISSRDLGDPVLDEEERPASRARSRPRFGPPGSAGQAPDRGVVSCPATPAVTCPSPGLPSPLPQGPCHHGRPARRGPATPPRLSEGVASGQRPTIHSSSRRSCSTRSRWSCSSSTTTARCRSASTVTNEPSVSRMRQNVQPFVCGWS
jgi:hypothetical protein